MGHVITDILAFNSEVVTPISLLSVTGATWKKLNVGLQIYVRKLFKLGTCKIESLADNLGWGRVELSQAAHK